MSTSRVPSYAPPPPYSGHQPDTLPYNSTGEARSDDSPPQPPDVAQSHPIVLAPLRITNLTTPLSETRPSLTRMDADASWQIVHRSNRNRPRSPSQHPPPETQFYSVSPPSPSTSASWSLPSPDPAVTATTATPPPPSSSSHSPIPFLSPLSPSPKGQISRSRSKFHPLSLIKFPRATRYPTTQITEHATRKSADQTRLEAEIARQRAVELEAVRRATEEISVRDAGETDRRAAAQAEARTKVKSLMQSLLSRELPSDEERISVFSGCSQACETVGLDLAMVLQEPMIEDQPPIYWAILNRPMASTDGEMAIDSLVLALLGVCRPVGSATLAAVRLACMMASDNALLQRLFRCEPALSPLSASDAMLLGPTNNGGDTVEVEETRDGTGMFVARIRILRFRLRMRVSKSVTVEFIASERIWTLRFSMVSEALTDGRVENKWLLSLELGEYSQAAIVDADLFITGSSHSDGDRDSDPTLAVPLGCTRSELGPGRRNAISVRLDDGPMGPHLINESSTLVDSKGTFHAQFNARLTQSALPLVVEDTSGTLSRLREPVTPNPETPPPPTIGIKEKKKKRRDSKKEVQTTLRRGGR
ncbi:hypothetical protein B0F90DRAFT_1667633 [Multifurca ochricompacta]|uniref:Uncharacterized protein n=1 Tax=Multifurca ochricompacta TaxID=376703 RepID=A0AAD4M7L5_9AGAM|nr:hypothetical protein B0F90DRAFT_1667633 [Multifurca ochricompacta]